jgi:hypothetical protein
MSNQLDIIKRETMLSTTNAWIKRLSAFASSNNINFDAYQKDIVVNTVRKITESGYDIYAYDQNNVADILYQTAFLRLNPSATPRHCYFINRDVWENGRKIGSKLEMGIEGEGNDEILRKFGVGIKRDQNNEAVGVHKVWIVREGDEYQEGYFSGISYTPPTWRPKLLKAGEKKGKVLKVVYPIERTDGEVDFWAADREDLQPIILKHIEQNLMGYRKADKEGFNKLMRTLRKLSFDDIIETHQDTEIAYKAYGKDNSLRLVQDSYVGSTGEAMIIRKLRNIAIRNFPKNFDTTVIESLYRETFEEKYDKDVVQPIVAPSVQIETKQDDIVSKLQKETETTLKEEVVIQDDIDKDLEGLV